jgi:peptidyl-tRNA hydrolase
MQDARRDEGRQYALPLVIRVERSSPPTRTDALEGAARAVLRFLSDPRVAGSPVAHNAATDHGATDHGATDHGGSGGEWANGEWTALARAWEDARIRKVVRRARGAAWTRALSLPGITVVQGSAEVRVYPPVPVDDWPADLAKLQVSGTDFSDPESPGAPAAGVPVLWLNPGLPITAGKAMAQAGHAAQLAWWELAPDDRSAWRAVDFDLRVRVADQEQWKSLVGSGLPVVTDGGFTEVAPGSVTVVADHPGLRRRL